VIEEYDFMTTDPSRPPKQANVSSRTEPSAGPRTGIVHGFWLVVEKLLRWCVHPRLRARLIGLCGARIGRNVRIYETQFFNLERGFSNLDVCDDVHIGPGCRLDLAGPLRIGLRSTCSPGVTILTHADAGSSHGSALSKIYPPSIGGATIGADCWIGANATLLSGAQIGDRVVVAAGSVVNRPIPSNAVAAGVPAQVRKMNTFDA
jgi:acetyltransferase-like isoleucine patch superfamily enzyme